MHSRFNKIKKALYYFKIQGFIIARRGVGGSRTRVQTSSQNVFYMRSFYLIVGEQQEKSGPTDSLFPEIFVCTSGIYAAYLNICDASDGTPLSKVSRETASA